MRRSCSPRERGAVAVEMAIVLPLLLLLIAGIVDIGRLLYTQAMMTNAAREGVRMVALGYPTADARARALESSPNAQGEPLVTAVTRACPATPNPTDSAEFEVSTTAFEWIILGDIAALFGASPDAPQPNSRASMRCLG